MCALAICRHKRAKDIIVVNNRLSILDGWADSVEKFGFEKYFDITFLTDRALQNLVKKQKVKCDILIIDEWQNMSSDKNVKTYAKVKRDYTIGLSATPIRKKGQNFYPLEKTLWGFANPNKKFDWQKTHGKMVYDPFSYSKEKWEDFRDYDKYISELPNFMRWEEIEKIEGAVENNGHHIKYFKNTIPVANPEQLQLLQRLNLVTDGKRWAMPKRSFGRKIFEAYLKQTGIKVDFPKIKAVNKDTPLLQKIDGIIERAPHGVLIVSEYKQIVQIIHDRHPDVGIWTGDIKQGIDNKVVVATSQVLGVGVDGLQHQFETIVVLDPVDETSGKYDDYRQLLWRVTGSRQQHDVNVIEFYYKEDINV